MIQNHILVIVQALKEIILGMRVDVNFIRKNPHNPFHRVGSTMLDFILSICIAMVIGNGIFFICELFSKGLCKAMNQDELTSRKVEDVM